MVGACKIWICAAMADIVLRRLTTANSNYVFTVCNNNRASIAEAEPHIVMLRIYGKMNVMFDRDEEERVSIALAERGFIPRFLTVFGNGRVEPYIEHTPVTATMFRELSTAKCVVKELKKIHSFISTDAMVANGAPVDKMWRRLETLQRHAREAQSRLLTRSFHLDWHADMFREIVEWDVFHDHAVLKAKAVASESPVVFGHCDIHHGNVLCTSNGVILIDFEYALPAARGFDFANYFCEFCSNYDIEGGHEVSYELYPNVKQRYEIFREYLGEDATDEFILQFDHETTCYLPFVHLQWAHWGLIKAQESHCSSFDHLRFAYLRYKEFKILTSSI